MEKAKFNLYLMTQKGFEVLNSFISNVGSEYINVVICEKDNNVQDDFYKQIHNLCLINNIQFINKKDYIPSDDFFSFCISWRWLVKEFTENQLIVLHDSLLPKYRGFAPLVSALIHGDSEIGATALFANDQCDCGNIILQKSLQITYPIKINDAIQLISSLYCDIVNEIAKKILNGEVIIGKEQNEEEATYSLWRNENDYFIDWDEDSHYIQRFIDSVGFPYKGSASYLNNKVRILDSEIVDDIKIVNRKPGKVIFIKDECPIVVCGKGLLKITSIIDDEKQLSLIPFKKLRSKFE